MGVAYRGIRFELVDVSKSFPRRNTIVSKYMSSNESPNQVQSVVKEGTRTCKFLSTLNRRERIQNENNASSAQTYGKVNYTVFTKIGGYCGNQKIFEYVLAERLG